MSQYYNIKGLKVRISDHEPNVSLRGSSDIYLYVKSVDNQLLSIESQIEYICEKRELDIEDFQVIINEWQDGTYSKDVFVPKIEEGEDNGTHGTVTEVKNKINQRNSEKLKDYTFKNTSGPELRAEIKELSEITGVSQSYIKKHFNIK